VETFEIEVAADIDDSCSGSGGRCGVDDVDDGLSD
jgi:hypothetical protein